MCSSDLKKTDQIDPSVGILVHKKVGDLVEKGEALFTVLANDKDRVGPAQKRLLSSVKISNNAQEPTPLFYGVIS